MKILCAKYVIKSDFTLTFRSIDFYRIAPEDHFP